MPDGAVDVTRNVVYAVARRFEPARLVDERRTLPAPVQSPQIPGLLEHAMGSVGFPMTEDCLTLDVFAPRSPRRPLPVVVWIHGGAFTNGTAHASWYDGRSLARRGCVVVCLNYRLGAFGFTGGNDLGLQDQMTGLEWVRRNVADFGGDPGNVTLFGESAGGCSVVALFAAPSSSGLFERGWAMSPSLGQLRSPDRALDCERRLLEELEVGTREQAVWKTVDEVLAAQGRLLADPNDVVTMFSPTVGGTVLPTDSDRRVAVDPRALVVGTTRDESRLWVAMNPRSSELTDRDVRARFEARFGGRATEAWEEYSRHRPGSSPAEMLAALQTDESFRIPVWRLIDGRDRAGSPTWSYYFTWPTPVFDGILGSCHGLDIPFVFDNLDAPNVEHFIGSSPAHRHLADTLAGALVHFATTGVVDWSPTAGRRTTLRIDATNEVVVDPERAIHDLWNV